MSQPTPTPTPSQPGSSQRLPRPGPPVPNTSTSSPPESMTSILLSPLTDLHSLSLLLFQSLSPTQNKPPPPPPIEAFVECDVRIARALQLARVHQAKQRRIEALVSEILELEERWRDVIAKMEDGRRSLEATIDEGEERIRAIQAAKDAAVPYTDLLAYAQHIAAFTAAPPGMPPLTPGQPPPPLFFPPFPNEEKMQRGAMSVEKPLGPLGETRSVGRVKEPTPAREPERARAYRPADSRPVPMEFDLDLDLNPDL